MRGIVAERQLRLLQLLDARKDGLEPEEAARIVGARRRTVYRDFEVLQRAGFPLISDLDGRRARWRVDPNYRHRLQLSLSWSELLALSTGADLLKGLAGTLFHEGAVSALEKIRATLPRGLSDRFDRGAQIKSAHAGGHDYQSRGAMTQALVEAMSDRTTVIARYRARGKAAARRRIDPYHLRAADGLYVIGFDHQRGGVRTFLLDRFDSVEPTEEEFEVLPSFSVQNFLDDMFLMWGGKPVAIRLRIAPEAAQLFMERKFHPTQVSQRMSDGGALVTLRAPIVPPLIAWLLGFGSSVLSAEPDALRTQLWDGHTAAARRLGVPSPEMTHVPAKKRRVRGRTSRTAQGPKQQELNEHGG